MDACSQKEKTCGRAKSEKREFHPDTPFEIVVVLARSRILHVKGKTGRGGFEEAATLALATVRPRTLFFTYSYKIKTDE